MDTDNYEESKMSSVAAVSPSPVPHRLRYAQRYRNLYIRNKWVDSEAFFTQYMGRQLAEDAKIFI